MTLTESNYYSPEMGKQFFSVSQVKLFTKCEAAAMAQIRGEWTPERGRALLLGQFVDEHLTGTAESLSSFFEKNENEIFKKNGEPYADIDKAIEAVAKVRSQALMMEYLSGEHQTIMTGEICGVPFKGKFDSYKPGEFIADLKYLASLRSPNMFTNVVDYWGYALQGAVYQELVYQNTGKRLPFYLVIVTKETPPHIAVCQVNQFKLDEELEKLKKVIGRYAAIKAGEIEPERCEDYNCDFCTTTKVLTEPIDSDLLGMSTAQIRALNPEI